MLFLPRIPPMSTCSAIPSRLASGFLAISLIGLTACGDDGSGLNTTGSGTDGSGTDGSGTDGSTGPTGTGSSGGGGGTGGSVPDGPLVDPNCVDGMYTEVLPDPSLDISDLAAGYSPGNATQFMADVLARRYSVGHEILLGASETGYDCADRWLDLIGTPSDVSEFYGDFQVVVHECGHGFDLDMGGFTQDWYYINDSPLILICTEGDSTDRNGKTFARSLIREDEYQALNPNDSYAGTYLDGDPYDSNFDGGDQGFNMLFEETVQYVNSLATGYALTNELAATGWTSSYRDGILTFLWYVPRYLRMARLDFPDAYAHLSTGEDGCWRRAILTVWGRAWLYLGATEGMDHLGISDDMLMGLVSNPDLVGEIQLLREAEGCPAPDEAPGPHGAWGSAEPEPATDAVSRPARPEFRLPPAMKDLSGQEK